MASVAVEHTYRYRYTSNYLPQSEEQSQARLSLATDTTIPIAAPETKETTDSFFDGVLLNPKRAAALLQGVAAIVAARFNNPNWQRLADPVVTCGASRLRFEGFSRCCSAYVRADFLPEAVEGCWNGCGTTNVDFNAPMLAALRSIRQRDYVGFSVGNDQVAISRGGEHWVERKVSLPIRWLKGFLEIQAYQSRMVPMLEVSGLQARNFLYSLPRVKSRTPLYILPSGQGLRLSRVAGRGAVKAAGLERLRVLEPLVHEAEHLRVWGDDETGTSAWELVFPDARFHLILTADVWRGFSGEGQMLSTLAETRDDKSLDSVQSAFASEAMGDIGILSRKTGIEPAKVRTALAILGTRGLVGYDLDGESYFHRVLPFDMTKIESLQPRLIVARKLLDEGKVRISKTGPDGVEAFVEGKDVSYFVRIGAEESKCTCPWYAKHQNERGPCKHILAVQIKIDENDASS